MKLSALSGLAIATSLLAPAPAFAGNFIKFDATKTKCTESGLHVVLTYEDEPIYTSRSYLTGAGRMLAVTACARAVAKARTSHESLQVDVPNGIIKGGNDDSTVIQVDALNTLSCSRTWDDGNVYVTLDGMPLIPHNNEIFSTERKCQDALDTARAIHGSVRIDWSGSDSFTPIETSKQSARAVEAPSEAESTAAKHDEPSAVSLAPPAPAAVPAAVDINTTL
jgi:hypothetical protein